MYIVFNIERGEEVNAAYCPRGLTPAPAGYKVRPQECTDLVGKKALASKVLERSTNEWHNQGPRIELFGRQKLISESVWFIGSAKRGKASQTDGIYGWRRCSTMSVTY